MLFYFFHITLGLSALHINILLLKIFFISFREVGRGPTGFYNQKLWDLSFQHWNLGLVGLVLVLVPQRESSQLRYSSLFLTTTCRCGTSMLCISAPPTSFDVVSSLYPYLYDFCSSTLQAFLSDGAL